MWATIGYGKNRARRRAPHHHMTAQQGDGDGLGDDLDRAGDGMPRVGQGSAVAQDPVHRGDLIDPVGMRNGSAGIDLWPHVRDGDACPVEQ